MKKLSFISLSLFVVSCEPAPSQDRVDHVVDKLHLYASQANGEAYFDLFADDAVFFGTDINERWDKEAFREYGMARFAAGTGWTYLMKERNVYFSDDGRTCWFDETLTNDTYGEFRGTGALKVVNGEWKIVQYSLLLPIPNELFIELFDLFCIFHEQFIRNRK